MDDKVIIALKALEEPHILQKLGDKQLDVRVKLTTTDTRKMFYKKMLIDSGCSSSCISQKFIQENHLKTHKLSLCHDLAKQPSHYLYFFFFYFILDLLHKRECGKVLCHKVTWQRVTMSYHMISHNRCGKIVHRPYSSCISSIENLMGTLSSSLCQSLNKEQLALFWLGV